MSEHKQIDWLSIARKHGYAFPDARMQDFVAELIALARAGQQWDWERINAAIAAEFSQDPAGAVKAQAVFEALEPMRIARAGQQEGEAPHYLEATTELSLPELVEQFAAVAYLGGKYALSAGACAMLHKALTAPDAVEARSVPAQTGTVEVKTWRDLFSIMHPDQSPDGAKPEVKLYFTELENAALRAQLASAQKDAERLDWIEANKRFGMGWAVNTGSAGVISAVTSAERTMSIREAIDAARAQLTNPTGKN